MKGFRQSNSGGFSLIEAGHTGQNFGTREELTSPGRQNFTTNSPRRRCLSDEHGLVALGLAAQANVGA